MKSSKFKVMHNLAGRPMLWQVINLAQTIDHRNIISVISPAMMQSQVPDVFNNAGISFVTQDQQLGTGDAVKAALPSVANDSEISLVLYGDTPLVTAVTVNELLTAVQASSKAALGLITFDCYQPNNYARVQTNNGLVAKLIEFKDASNQERELVACNSGIMAIKTSLLPSLLEHITTDNAAGEYYLTDLVKIAQAIDHDVVAVTADIKEMAGVNNKAELAQAEAIIQQRLRQYWLEQGVMMQDPSTVYLTADTSFGQDVVLEPNIYFNGKVTVGDNCTIRAGSYLEDCTIGDSSVIGPFARLRPGTVLDTQCKVGNFVEIKKSNLATGSKVNHLSYVGDATIGTGTNIGAGVIFCNYDGIKKHHTIIGNNNFIGSNSCLVAPVNTGDNVLVAAGTVVTNDVASDNIVIGRVRADQKDRK